MKFIKLPIFILISSILVFFDQYTKALAVKFFKNNAPYAVINNIIDFTYVENNGAAFGILQGKHVLFYVLTVVVLIFILYVFCKTSLTKHFVFINSSLLLIFSGAIGNFIDRVRNQFVIDFIYFKPIDFPVFNVADSYITIGTIILFVSLFTINKHDDII